MCRGRSAVAPRAHPCAAAHRVDGGAGADGRHAAAATAAAVPPAAAAVPTVAAGRPARRRRPSAAAAAKPEVGAAGAWSAREDAAICELVAVHGQDSATVAAAAGARPRAQPGRLRGGGKLPSSLMPTTGVRRARPSGHTARARPPTARRRPSAAPHRVATAAAAAAAAAGHGGRRRGDRQWATRPPAARRARRYPECLPRRRRAEAALPPLKDLPKELRLEGERRRRACVRRRRGGRDDLIGDVDLHELEAILWGDATSARDRRVALCRMPARIHGVHTAASATVHNHRGGGECTSLLHRRRRRRRGARTARRGCQRPSHRSRRAKATPGDGHPGREWRRRRHMWREGRRLRRRQVVGIKPRLTSKRLIATQTTMQLAGG